VAGLRRSLGRGKVKGLGEVLDRGEIALVEVIDVDSLAEFERTLKQALEIRSEGTSLTDDQLKTAAEA
jgi:hypothetical protein